MNYKSSHLPNGISTFQFNNNAFNHGSLFYKNGKVFLSQIQQNEIYEDIDNYPGIFQEFENIEREVQKVGIGNACVYEFLKNTDRIIERSPSPYPDDLANCFLPILIRLINDASDEDIRTICLKIIAFISLSTREEITMRYDNIMLNSIFAFVSAKKPFLPSSFILNFIYSCSILLNLLTCPKECQNIYDFYIDNNLLQILNDKISTISSSQELLCIFALIIQILKISITKKVDIAQFIFLVPSMIEKLELYSGNLQKKPLKCLYLFLQDYNCLQECILNNVQNTLYNLLLQDKVPSELVHIYLKCVDFFCSDSIMSPFDNQDFYEKLIDLIKSALAKDIHEIIIFFTQVIDFDPDFDQAPLIKETYDNIDLHDFSYKTECINFFIKLIIDNTFNVPDELSHTVIFYLLNTAYQMHEESLNGCLQVIDIVLSRGDQFSEEILANPDFFVFLEECSNDALNSECSDMALSLLQQYQS